MMKKFLLTAALLGVSFGAQAHDPSESNALMIDNAKQTLGTIDLVQGAKGVLIIVDLKNLPPGAHGFHIHHKGDCGDHDHFKNAGGHVTDGNTQHGLLNPNGPELGDLPNLIVHDDGTVHAEIYAPDLKIVGGTHALLDADGSAFMIHDNPDDHHTQPIGGAGKRIACGVIKKNSE